MVVYLKKQLDNIDYLLEKKLFFREIPDLRNQKKALNKLDEVIEETNQLINTTKVGESIKSREARVKKLKVELEKLNEQRGILFKEITATIQGLDNPNVDISSIITDNEIFEKTSKLWLKTRWNVHVFYTYMPFVDVAKLAKSSEGDFGIYRETTKREPQARGSIELDRNTYLATDSEIPTDTLFGVPNCISKELVASLLKNKKAECCKNLDKAFEAIGLSGKIFLQYSAKVPIPYPTEKVYAYMEEEIKKLDGLIVKFNAMFPIKIKASASTDIARYDFQDKFKKLLSKDMFVNKKQTEFKVTLELITESAPLCDDNNNLSISWKLSKVKEKDFKSTSYQIMRLVLYKWAIAHKAELAEWQLALIEPRADHYYEEVYRQLQHHYS